MTPFASVALFRRDGKTVFKPPRKERPNDITQARKAAMRYWSGAANGDTLLRVFVVREYGGMLEISESEGAGKPWLMRADAPSTAAREPHLAAAMAELGVDPTDAMPPVPDALVINGFTYRREI